jgi:hypothetical protein
MALVQESVDKVYEVPDTGNFIGTIIDVVDLKNVQTNFGVQDQTRVVWVLNKMDSEGKPFRAVSQVNSKMSRTAGKESKLYKLAEGVFGGEPPTPFDTESLMGRSNELVLVKGISKKSGKPFAEVKVIMPLKAGTPIPQAPQGFVRTKDKTGGQQRSATPQTVAPAQSSGATQVATAPVQPSVTQPAATTPKVDVAF